MPPDTLCMAFMAYPSRHTVYAVLDLWPPTNCAWCSVHMPPKNLHCVLTNPSRRIVHGVLGLWLPTHYAWCSVHLSPATLCMAFWEYASGRTVHGVLGISLQTHCAWWSGLVNPCHGAPSAVAVPCKRYGMTWRRNGIDMALSWS